MITKEPSTLPKSRMHRDNGLIKRAQDAKDKWETAEKSDLESLNNINNFLALSDN